MAVPAAHARFIPTIAVAFVVALSGLLCFKASLPNNRVRAALDGLRVESDGTPYYLPRGTNSYDNVVTQVTAYNFARDGFLRTHFLPNRGGAQISLGDRTQTQCEHLGGPLHRLAYKDAFGRTIENASLNNDCIYVHYPPLADWVFGALARLGLRDVLAYKLLAILLNGVFLMLVFFWLKGQLRPAAALVALVLAGTMPAFLRWADALYFHGFQYLFLLATVLAWGRALRTGDRRFFALTWLFYFADALVSHQLTLCTAVLLTGLFVIHHGLDRQSVRAGLRALSLQATAPVAAFAILVGLSASLLGTAKTWSNLTSTMTARMAEGSQLGGIRGGMGLLLTWIADDLVSWKGVVIAAALVIFASRALATSSRPRLVLLGIFFAGGITFWAAFPGTTSEHFWMMYRQIMPFILLTVGLVADLFFACLEARARGRMPIACALACALFLVWVGQRNLTYVVDDVRWNRAANAVVRPANLVRSHLDILHWREDDQSRVQGLYNLPVSGMRVQEPPRWMLDFRLLGPGTSHYEIWWLEPQPFKQIQLLVDAAQVETVTRACFVSLFDGADFQRLDSDATAEPFVPDATERRPLVPYAWIHYAAPQATPARALRLTCGGMSQLTLHQIEAYAS